MSACTSLSDSSYQAELARRLVALTEGAVSYTHLTLPTNREV